MQGLEAGNLRREERHVALACEVAQSALVDCRSVGPGCACREYGEEQKGELYRHCGIPLGPGEDEQMEGGWVIVGRRGVGDVSRKGRAVELAGDEGGDRAVAGVGEGRGGAVRETG